MDLLLSLQRMKRWMQAILAALVVLSLSYNASIFRTGTARAAVRRQTVVDMRALLRERLRVRKLKKIGKGQKNQL